MHLFDTVVAGPWNMEMDAGGISYTGNPAIYCDAFSSRISSVAFPEGKLFTHIMLLISEFGIMFSLCVYHAGQM